MRQRLGGARARHWRKIEAKVIDHHHSVRPPWYVIECKCGWSSPLCISWAAAQAHYDRHVRREARRRAAERAA